MEPVGRKESFRASRWQLALYALGSAAFVAAGIWLALAEPPSNLSSLRAIQREALRPWVASACILFFGFGLVVFLKRLFFPADSLVIDEAGLHFPASFAHPKVSVDWQEISGFQVVKVYGNGQVCVGLHDPAPFLARLPAIARWLGQANQSSFGTPIVLSSWQYGPSANELAARFKDFQARTLQ